MKILALTGSIATGKSTVAKIFEKYGAVVIAADQIAHQTYLPKTPLYREMLRRYGRGLLDAKGYIDRKKLGAVLFRSKKERAWLEAKIHPATRLLIGREIQKALRRGAKLILVEAALHVETGWHRPFHGLIVVKAPPKVHLERLLRREGMKVKDAQRMIRSQMPQASKVALADWVIDNSEDLGKTETQVRKILSSSHP